LLEVAKTMDEKTTLSFGGKEEVYHLPFESIDQDILFSDNIRHVTKVEKRRKSYLYHRAESAPEKLTTI